MRFAASIKILGLLLMLFSLSMLPPIATSIYYQDHAIISFVIAFIITLFTGFLLWVPFHSIKGELKTRDGFLVVVLLWTVLSLFGALPFYIDLFPKLTFTDCFFETVSGLTTTGSTIFPYLDKLPRSILYYRQQLHFLGGMGIIVLAIAILPMLGIGGMQLYRAETAGPMKTSKLRPRMARTAKSLWYIYVGLVIVCAVLYWLAGMQPFDAIGESFSTIATGGFTTHSNSFAYYHSPIINSIAIIFMILGATNFSLHFQFIARPRIKPYFKDAEFRAFLMIIAIATLFVGLMLTLYHYKFHEGRTIVHSLFTVVSVATTTGFTTSHFNLWPTFIPYMLMFVAIVGGCGGSTAGGLKVLRLLLLFAQGKREVKRLIHPQGVFAVKLGKKILPENIIQSIWAFVGVYTVLFVILLLVLLSTGLDPRTAFGALASSISNTGASIGKVANNFDGIPTFAKWVLIFAMLAGRLEIFTILVLFSPSYWRK